MWALKEEPSPGKTWTFRSWLLGQQQPVLENNLAMTQRMGHDLWFLLVGSGQRETCNHDLPRRETLPDSSRPFAHLDLAENAILMKKSKSELDSREMLKSCLLDGSQEMRVCWENSRSRVRALRSTVGNSVHLHSIWESQLQHGFFPLQQHKLHPWRLFSPSQLTGI